MNETMPWWQSKTIWLGLLTSLAAFISAAGVFDANSAQLFVDIGIGVLGVATIGSRLIAKKQIGTTTTESQ
jgi:hypothetical protein